MVRGAGDGDHVHQAALDELGGPSDQTGGLTGDRTGRRGLLLAGAIGLALFALQVAWPASTAATPADLAPITVPGSGEPALIWRAFDPPGSLLCGAALQRGSGRAAVVIHGCAAQPATPERRFGLGYDALVVDVALPGGGRLVYDLLTYQRTGPWSATRFSQGAAPESTVAVREAYVRDGSDIVIQLESDVPAGLLSVGLRRELGGHTDVDRQSFAPLAPAFDAGREIVHAGAAPTWARQLPLPTP